MKKAMAVVLGTMLAVGAANADEILEVRRDTMVGGGFGGLSGFMLGAVAGPIGALVGGGLGYLAGQGVQQGAGLEQTLYVVRREDGSIDRIRSSDGGFLVGQQIRRDDGHVTAMQP